MSRPAPRRPMSRRCRSSALSASTVSTCRRRWRPGSPRRRSRSAPARPVILPLPPGNRASPPATTRPRSGKARWRPAPKPQRLARARPRQATDRSRLRSGGARLRRRFDRGRRRPGRDRLGDQLGGARPGGAGAGDQLGSDRQQHGGRPAEYGLARWTAFDQHRAGKCLE